MKTKQVTSYAAAIGKNAKSVDQLIADAISSLKTMRDKVQVASIAILMHAEKHGDYSKANDLVEGLGNGINRASLQKFFVDFGGLVVSEESGTFVGWSGKDHIRDNFESAKTTAWWTLKEAPSYKGFDLQAEISKLIDKANKELAKSENLSAEDKAKVSIDPEMLKQLNLIKGKVNDQLEVDILEELKAA